ncbi:MAG: primosomal protein N' [Planctomycetaceae bacterium]|jgi:primosomal protein N' (replication factor Y)|nr:primosomal protein N' [Planctomycetaceae bacterium]
MSRAPSLFDDEPDVPVLPPWEIDDLKNRKTAQVVFPGGYDAVLDYLVPGHLAGDIEPGMRVSVPLGKSNRSETAYCISVRKIGTVESGIRLKAITGIIDPVRLIDDKMLALTHWIAGYYLCPLGQVLESVLPAGVRTNAGTRLSKVLFVTEKQPAAENIKPLTAKQQYILETLRQAPEPLTMLELQRAAKCSAVPISALKQLGFIETKTLRRTNQSTSQETAAAVPAAMPYQLNAAQKQCLSPIITALRENRHETFLLHGVTGSGKTEVYIQAIHEAVKHRKQAIVLVPEISLTPQTVGRFKSRFADVAVLHSHLTDAERHRQWSGIAGGSVQVVVGARSAVFAPLSRLGLIVIDEEHENSFKQDSAPRYQTRDVARKRAELEDIPLILGSATPSLESYLSAATPDGGATLLTMPHRVNNLPLPYVGIVDLREAVRQRTTRGAIHRQLHQAIHESLQDGGQIILLLNRRGFSTHIQCPACGEALKCPNCDVSLTHHKSEEIALCHYCDYQVPAPAACPACQFAGIQYWGFGTQKLEAEIRSRFPNVSVLRMDTDTMQRTGAHEKALSQFRNGEVQILLGTQMIAKGLDFPNVTLVGVINADTALHLPDFRAAERTFHLITQVAGRTGRGEKGGRVIIQTFSPEHPAIRAAAKHDYTSFVKQELPVRQMLGYPPYTKMIRIVIRGENEMQTLEFANHFAQRLKTEEGMFKILGPAPAPFAKLRGYYRFHIHLHGTDGGHLRSLADSVSRSLKSSSPSIQWIIDIDPLDML